VGRPADPVHVSDDVVPSAQFFRVPVPAGTVAVTLPLEGVSLVTLDGSPLLLDSGGVRWKQPLAEPGALLVRTEPTAFDRGGAAWRGPAVVRTERGPIRLGNWGELGLRAWSGGVRYLTSVELPTGARDVVLDLGRVRGSAEVMLDGRAVGEAFCAPYRFLLGEVSGRRVQLAVTVYNTLAPYFDEATPTTWVFPSQLQSGLFGPVAVHFRNPPGVATETNTSTTTED
jgi:hypothetical protein